MTMIDKTVHQGRNLKRIREILGVKQDVLAAELGDDWNQQKISLLEQKEELDPGILDQVAKVLKVTPDAIKDFNEEAAIYNIQQNYEGSTLNQSPNYQYNYQPTFNPLDKVVELYERLVASEREKVELLQKMQQK
jgi:transcriptional regulator with XRE-family HTH domain